MKINASLILVPYRLDYFNLFNFYYKYEPLTTHYTQNGRSLTRVLSQVEGNCKHYCNFA